MRTTSRHRFQFTLLVFLCVSVPLWLIPNSRAQELPGTKPLTMDGDLAAQMVAGIDKYLMRELEKASKAGSDAWHVKTDSLANYLESVKPNR